MPLTAALKKFRHGAVQLLYPPKCMGCGTYLSFEYAETLLLENHFCSGCREKADGYLIQTPVCPCCGELHPEKSGPDHLCERCLTAPLKLGRVRASGQYRGILKTAIQKMKYNAALSISKTLETLLFRTFEDEFSDRTIHMLVPIPLHRKRLLNRGFNQSFILLRNFRKQHEKVYGTLPAWAVCPDAIKRVRKTTPQAGLDIETRKKNLKNAFLVPDPEKIKDRHILLIDDVFTTGATCDAAAEILLKNGAAAVDALVLARA